ncbi:hypothetical protein FOA52_004662, partial [Chlamydomonas sp. UWO 241]
DKPRKSSLNFGSLTELVEEARFNKSTVLDDGGLVARELLALLCMPPGSRKAWHVRELTEYGRHMTFPFPAAMLERQKLTAWYHCIQQLGIVEYPAGAVIVAAGEASPVAMWLLNGDAERTGPTSTSGTSGSGSGNGSGSGIGSGAGTGSGTGSAGEGGGEGGGGGGGTGGQAIRAGDEAGVTVLPLEAINGEVLTKEGPTARAPASVVARTVCVVATLRVPAFDAALQRALDASLCGTANAALKQLTLGARAERTAVMIEAWEPREGEPPGRPPAS